MLLPLVLMANMSQEEILTVYIYNFGRDVTWPNEQKLNSFKIFLYGKDRDLENAFNKLTQSKLLKGVKISFKRVGDIKEIIDPQLIFIAKSKHDDFAKVFEKFEGQPVLLVSKDYPNKRLVMVNLISKDKSVTFEINKANILNNRLETNQKLILNGGTEIDVARLYRQGQKSLATLERKLQSQQASILKQQDSIKSLQINIEGKQKEFALQEKTFTEKLRLFENEISKSNQQIEEKSTKNEELETLIKKLDKVINSSRKTIASQQDEISIQKKILEEKVKDREKLINEISGKAGELTKLKSEFAEQKNEVDKKEFQISRITKEISESVSILKEQQNKIDEQNTILKSQGETIASQKNILYLSWFIVVLVTLLVVTLSWAYINIRRVHQQLMQNDMELQKANDELVIAKDLALNASNSKSLFLANMSHEIRTPMNSILGFSEMLKKRLVKPDEKMFISSIQSSGNTLLRLINDILDLSKVESGKLELNYSYIDTQKLFYEIEFTFNDKAKTKDLDFGIELEEGFPKALWLDEIRLKQVLFNLIGNALKFTDDGFIKVLISSRSVAGDVAKKDLKIQVIDSGIGVPDEHKEKIFGNFEQRTGQSMSKYGGTGLGLAICKTLVELMNGSLKVKDTEGKGTTFTVNLPGVEIPEFEKVENNLNLDYLNYEFAPAKILVVDDVELNREVLRNFLQDKDFEILEAQDGKEAVEVSQKQKPDLILMDLKMPVMDGREAAAKIKDLQGAAASAIIAVTASGFCKGKDDSLQHFDSYLRKPISQERLIMKLSEYLPFQKKEELEPKVDDKQIFMVPQTVKKELEGQLKILEEGVNTGAIKEIIKSLRIHSQDEQCRLLANELEILLGKFDLFSVQNLISESFLEKA